ncbi:hypothetical protein [Anatilimnocola floriformis]|uniref:hypothetical protein n=1 Tax=Anatilimnocola floriformis TaxID=2948575 RepID=UPI0020C3963B|nr:hypothetical protein [Anatilimnocola floriformis]
MNQRIVLFLALASLGSLRALPAQTPMAIKIEHTSGRRWEGLIDARSTPEQLMLRFERGTAVLLRPIPWSEIRTAEVDGKAVTVTELAKSYESLATSATPFAERTKITPEVPANEQPLPPPPNKVAAIACDALLANWDADVETDGLAINLQPLDAWQEITAAAGTLEVELYTLQARTFHHAPNSRGRSVEPIARWSQAVNWNDYRSRGAYIQLPFQAAHPEFDGSLGFYGLVHIKFSVPGSGVFEQTIDGVRIRPWSPIRDSLQLNTGYRFLPHEGTGRGKASWSADNQ